MDSAIGMSDVTTVTPSESASQAPTKKGPTPRSQARPRKERNKSGRGNGAPTGAVKVPPGGSSATSKASPVLSETIPLSGWGTLDLHPYKKEIEPTFTTDARPYADMVDTVYSSIRSRYSSGGKHLPFALFRYYCLQLWWMRALYLHRANGRVLDVDQKDFLEAISQQHGLQVPSHVAQYLCNMGNFMQGGENYYFRLLDYEFGSAGSGTVQKGWLDTTDASNRVTSDSFWVYAQIPVPGVFTSAVCNEADSTLPSPGVRQTLDHVAPVSSGPVYPTENIIGWSNVVPAPGHSSWRSAYSSLGWSSNTLPPDVQTSFNYSSSTMKWVSDRLATMADFKVHPASQLVLSTQGHPMQSYFLGTETPVSQVSQFPETANFATNKMCASRHSSLALLSRYAPDATTLAPAFAFGYRLERSRVFKDYNLGTPRYHSESNYSPWLLVNEKGDNRLLLTAAQLAGMNRPFEFGSQSVLSVRRFATHELNRSLGLDAALVLSETK